MSDAKLWIDEAGCTATITGVNVNYTMPLWVFDVMRDIIVTEAEKKVEVTHRDFDIQQELLDRYSAENAKLRERIHELEMEGSDHFYRTAYAEDANRTLEAENARLRERSAKTLEVGTRWMAKAARFESENTKLRELVRSAVRCITDVPDCDSCALGEQVSGVWVCHLIGAAKELGVEVDE